MGQFAYANNKSEDLQDLYKINEAIFNELPTPVAVIDRAQSVLSANSSFCATFAIAERRVARSVCNACSAGPCLLAFSLGDVLAESAAGKEQIVHYENNAGSHRAVLLHVKGLNHLQSYLLTAEDISDRQEVETRQKRPESEFHHRMNSTLQVVKSLVTQTAHYSDSLESFLSAFYGRLSALASAEGAICRNVGSPIHLQAIVEQAVSLHDFDKERVRIAPGPKIELPPEEALPLGLALHELFTNALRHGALSAAGGRVDVSWKVTAGDEIRVHMVWKEAGGPKVTPPQKRGFGVQMLERLLPFDLSAKVNLRFDGQGLKCELEFPLPEAGRVIWE